MIAPSWLDQTASTRSKSRHESCHHGSLAPTTITWWTMETSTAQEAACLAHCLSACRPHHWTKVVFYIKIKRLITKINNITTWNTPKQTKIIIWLTARIKIMRFKIIKLLRNLIKGKKSRKCKEYKRKWALVSKSNFRWKRITIHWIKLMI